MPLFPHHAQQPAHADGMNLAPLLASMAAPAPGGGVTLGADVISANLHLVPPRAFPVLGLYVTQAGGGTGYIAATQAQLAEYPDCVKISQLPAGDPFWADVLDFEAGAATVAEIPQWAAGAQESYHAGTHPGQRMPTVYVSASNVHVAVNALVSGGIKGGVGIGLANWNLTEPQAAQDVIDRAGPFPIVWVQYADPGLWDLDIFATAWLNARSGKPKPLAGYDAPRDLRATGGHTSVRLTWQPPGTPGLPAPSNYEIFIYRGTAATRSSLVPTYPRTEGPALEFEGGSLEQGKTYTAHVVATGPDGGNVRPFTYASVTFRTG